jgi:hypothetical protein
VETDFNGRNLCIASLAFNNCNGYRACGKCKSIVDEIAISKVYLAHFFLHLPRIPTELTAMTDETVRPFKKPYLTEK